MTDVIVLEDLLRIAVERGASDIHLKVPSCPALRVDGHLERLASLPSVKPADVQDILATMLASLPHSAKQVEFELRGAVDFAYAHAGLGRFRVNAYRQRGSVSIVIRLVPFGIPRFADLGLPDVARSLVAHGDGLVLVSGPAGSGVTTTVGALIDVLNDADERNIVTVEDPIELLHSDRRCTINQREVGLDTNSFADALAGVLRHDPDVVVVSALRDLPTVEAALAVAGNGVLVLAAITSHSAGDAIERLVNHFPDARQRRARIALGACLRGVIAQRLLSPVAGHRRELAAEVLVATDAVRKAVVGGADAERLADLAAAGAGDGMISLDQALARLVASGKVSRADALQSAGSPSLVEQLLR
jgi:twitching motility protein PilT